MNIKERMSEHYMDSLLNFQQDRIVGLFLQGSQNYKLDIKTSDVDTKLVVVPTFKEIAMNSKPVSTTYIRKNDEHIDFKDVRLMLSTFRKQNLNFLEILFTEHFIINSLYEKEWNKLVDIRESIARYNPIAAVKSMKGIAMEKYHAMEHLYPSKVDVITKYGYDPKQLHHLLRIKEYIARYISGIPYQYCLVSEDREYLIEVKKGLYELEDARVEAIRAIKVIEALEKAFCAKNVDFSPDPYIDSFLDDVQYNIMKIATLEELK